MKRIYALILAAFVAAAIFLLWLERQPEGQVSPNVQRPEDMAESPKHLPIKAPDATQPAIVQEPKTTAETAPQTIYQIESVNVLFDPNAEAKSKEKRPYQLRGLGSTARIVDMQGRTLVQADPKIGIYGCEVSPNGGRLTVDYGDSNYEVINPATGLKVVLPKQPLGENKLGFGSYYWVDDDTLVAESGDQRLDARGNPVRSDDNVSQTRLYVYSVSRQELAGSNCRTT